MSSPIETLRGVGPKVRSALARLGLQTAGDLLGYFPFRYEDYSAILPIARLQAGQTATVRGRIELIGSRRSFRRRLVITEAALRDETGYLKLVWFNQPFLKKLLKPGDRIMVSGRADWQYGSFQMASPSYEKIQAEQTHVGRIVPVYGVTEGLTPKYLRSLVRQVLPLAASIPDPLPPGIRRSEKLPALARALTALHFPASNADLAAARQRLDFDALLRIQLESLRTKALLRSNPSPVLKFHETKTKAFVASLPWRLTTGQRRAAWEIIRDLGKPHPMNRLLQGDVGSGKTVVAAMGLLAAAWNGFQSVLMAPTEILAEQHFNTLQSLIGRRLPVALLTGARSNRSDKRSSTKPGLKLAIRRGEIPVVVGTHALLEADLRFQRLGLAVIDEQHRFGVRQRQALREYASIEGNVFPHFLSMTATPIPRTIALTLYGDLDISSLTELPKNRKPVITKLITAAGRPEMVAFIRKQLTAGHQAFVVTALIEESDALGIKAATALQARLQTTVFPERRIGLLHGRMSAKAKETVMRKFLNRKFDVLVSTAVIEVGIDVPNATVMVIEDAERFGFAQLHQFRGRVGRSDAQSYCFLASESTGAAGPNQRLIAFTRLKNGFEVAETDFRRRGPGELRGGRQSGEADLGMSSLRNLELIRRSRAVAERLLAEDPTLERFPGIQRLLDGRGVHWE